MQHCKIPSSAFLLTTLPAELGQKWVGPWKWWLFEGGVNNTGHLQQGDNYSRAATICGWHL